MVPLDPDQLVMHQNDLAKNLAPTLSTGVCQAMCMAGRADLFAVFADTPQIPKLAEESDIAGYKIRNCQENTRELYSLRTWIIQMAAGNLIRTCDSRALRSGVKTIPTIGDLVDIYDPKTKRRTTGIRVVGRYQAQFVVERNRDILKHLVCWAMKIHSSKTMLVEETGDSNEEEIEWGLLVEEPSVSSKDVLLTHGKADDRAGYSGDLPYNGNGDIESGFGWTNSSNRRWEYVEDDLYITTGERE